MPLEIAPPVRPPRATAGPTPRQAEARAMRSERLSPIRRLVLLHGRGDALVDGVRTVEWPTVAVAVVIHGGWLALTWYHATLPLIVIVGAGAWLIGWHGSLQHETIHGHPTGRRRIDTLIGSVPLSLWLPYGLYRRSHLAHHASAHITHPAHDPESRYVVDHKAMGRWAAGAQATLTGRLLVGPMLAVAALLREEAARVTHAPVAVARDWLPHCAGVIAVVAWLEWTGFGVSRYLLLVVYPGTSLTLLRSFAEHRVDRPGPARAATVERGGLLALLYLNNNLHAAHHERPGLAWYRLPAYHHRHRGRLVATGGAPYRSYGDIVRRFALRRHDDVVHPESAT